MSTADRADRARARIEAFGRRRPEALRLARFASLAVRVDAALLRALRLELLPGTDAGTEADLWFSPLTESVSSQGFVLETDVVDRLRLELADDIVDGEQRALDHAAEVTRSTHDQWPASLQIEERVTWLSLRRAATPAAADDRQAQVEDLLRQMLKAMTGDATRGVEIARWAQRALPRLPALARETDAALLLALGAAERIHMPIVFSGADRPGSLPEHTGWVLPTGRFSTTVTIGVRRYVDGLEFLSPDLVPSDMVVTLPRTTPLHLQIGWTAGTTRMAQTISIEPGRRVAVPIDAMDVRLRTLAGEELAVERAGATTSADIPAQAPLQDDPGRACVRVSFSTVDATRVQFSGGFFVSSDTVFALWFAGEERRLDARADVSWRGGRSSGTVIAEHSEVVLVRLEREVPDAIVLPRARVGPAIEVGEYWSSAFLLDESNVVMLDGTVGGVHWRALGEAAKEHAAGLIELVPHGDTQRWTGMGGSPVVVDGTVIGYLLKRGSVPESGASQSLFASYIVGVNEFIERALRSPESSGRAEVAGGTEDSSGDAAPFVGPRRALIVAIEHYPLARDVAPTLPGVRRDGERFSALFAAHGIPSQLCADTEATRDGLIHRLRELIDQSRDQLQQFFFVFAGHLFRRASQPNEIFLAMSDFADAATGASACIRFTEIRSLLATSLGRGDHFYFLCGSSPVQGGKALNAPLIDLPRQDASTGQANTYTLQLNDTGLSSRPVETLLEGLRGTERSIVTVGPDQYAVSFQSLATYLHWSFKEGVTYHIEGPGDGQLWPVSSAGSRTRPTPRLDFKYTYFVSYAQRDFDKSLERFLDRLQQQVQLRTGKKESQAVSFLDRSKIALGEPSDEALTTALQSSAVMVSVLSPWYFASDRTGQEVEYFLRIRGPQTNALVPIVWIPSPTLPPPFANLQLTGPEMPDRYRKEGARALAEMEGGSTLEQTTLALARTIVQAAEQVRAQGATVENPPAFDSIPSPWPAVRSGPHSVRIFIAAVGVSEMASIRRSLGAYGETGLDWRPFYRFSSEVAALSAQKIANDMDIASETIAVTADLSQRLDEARKANVIALVLVDAWALRLAGQLQPLLALDHRNDDHVATIVLLDETDDETKAQKSSLEALIQETFRYHHIAPTPTYLRVDSPDQFKAGVREVLHWVRDRINRAGRRHPARRTHPPL